MKSFKIFFILFLFKFGTAFGEVDSIYYDIQTSGIVGTGNRSPFLIQSQNYGQFTSASNLATTNVTVGKEFIDSRKFDYSFKVNQLCNYTPSSTEAYLHEYYLKLKLYCFRFTAGAKEEILGTQDSTLSSGGILFSKNARPMPKLTLGIEQFTPVPYTGGYIEIKGAVSHGWFDNTLDKNVMLHHKYGYIRIGGKLPVHIQYGLEHVAVWGGTVVPYGAQPSSFHDYIDIFTAGHGGSNSGSSEQVNTLGNHILSQSVKLETEISDFKLNMYWQNINEDPPIYFILENTINMPDGLWGVSIKNKKMPFVSGVLYEYLNTTDQSGTLFQKDGVIYGGGDNYFNNYLFQRGWTYNMRTIGTPFILPTTINNGKWVYGINNRMNAHHFGIEGEVSGVSYKMMASISNNYGRYDAPLTPTLRNTATYLVIYKNFEKLGNWGIKLTAGTDFGQLYGNNKELIISIIKKGLLF